MKRFLVWLIAILFLLCFACSAPSVSVPTPPVPEPPEPVPPTPPPLEDVFTEPGQSDFAAYTDYGTTAGSDSIGAYDTSKWFYNRLTVPLADPFVFVENDVYYVYGTTDRTGSATVDCYVTRDFAAYTHYENVYVPQAGSWERTGEGNALVFAPELFRYGNEYFLSYSNVSAKDGVRYLSMASASSPLGPFEPVHATNTLGVTVDGYAAPLFAFDQGGQDVLDQHFYFDGDEIYLYYAVFDNRIGEEYIEGVRMIDIYTPDWSTRKILVRPGRITPQATDALLTWERYIDWFPVAEAPAMLRGPNGKYYLTYSVNHYPYRYYTVCYAVADDPLGTFTKPYAGGREWTNLLLGYAGGQSGEVYDQWSGFMSGCGHHCFFKIGEQWMIGYHAHLNRGLDTSTSWVARAFAIDYLYFDANGEPYGEGPTYSLQFLPEKISGYRNVAPLATLKTVNVTGASRLTDGYVAVQEPLEYRWLGKEAVLGEGRSYVLLDFGKEYVLGGISVYNSTSYGTMLKELSFVQLFDERAIFDVGFPAPYYDDTKKFLYPAGAFQIELNDVKASRLVLCFDAADGARLNEIRVFAKEV